MNQVLIALGGNQGNVEITFSKVCQALGCDLLQIQMSRLYRTEPVFDKPGCQPIDDVPPYLNAVLRASTFHTPDSLLARLLEVEKHLGRKRPAPECSPRPIDLDLLLFNDLVITPRNPGDLELPHPRMHLRDFVLRPACDVAPDWIHPVLHQTLSNLLHHLEMQRG